MGVFYSSQINFPMNILITGIHGFVGSNLVMSLREEHTLYGLDIVAPEKEGVVRTYSWADLEQRRLPEVDAIIHLAGKAHDTKNRSAAQAYFDINTGLTQKIFDYFRESSAGKFIFFSSVKAAADFVPGEVLTEEVVPAPVGPYGESKIAAENYILGNEELSMKTIPQCKQSKDVLSEANDEWRVNGFESVTGQGVKGSYKGVTYYAGNQRLMQGKRISPALQEAASAWEAEAQTVIWFANETEVLAVIAIADRIKPSSIHAIRTLQAEGIEVHLLTGDNEATARAIARQAGITHYRAGVLPQDKAAFVKELQAQGKVIAMVGDGINDSAALAQADLSIAMGSGSDIAMDVAKMTIISSDLTKIPEALQLSRLTVRTIRQNLFWAFIYNIIGVPIAAGVLYPVNGFLLNPMIGGAAMAFSSVSVVTNSLRLRRKKLSDKEETDLSVKEANVDVERAKVAVEPAKEAVEQTHMDVEPHKEEKTMEKQFKVSGMMCQHCRMHVEKALNKLEGVSATVTLDPPVATVKFSGKTYTLDELQQQVTEEAGEYTLSDN